MTVTAPSAVFLTTPITEADLQVGFDCGQHALNDFLARHALPNDRRGLGRTFIMRRPEEPAGLPPVVGFYTLSMAVTRPTAVAGLVPGKLPGYDLPVALIGRFAVDRRAQGLGLGGTLLGDALARVVAAREQVGCVGIIVDAKDAAAVRFYEHHAFVLIDQLESYQRRLFLPLTAVVAASEGSAH